MCSLNKEKVLFMAVFLFSFLVFNQYYPLTLFMPDAFKNPVENASGAMYRPMKDEEIFPEGLFSYWSGNSRNLFSKVQEKKKLPPVALDLPVISLPSRIMLSPVPGTASCFWQPFVSQNLTALAADQVTMSGENLERYLVVKEGKEMSALAQKAKGMVRMQDTIFMKDGKRFRGKIISENAQEILLSILENKATQNFVIPAARILKVEKQIQLDEVYQQLWQELDAKDSRGFLELAQSCEENALYEVAQDYFQKIVKSFPTWAEGYLGFASFLRRRLDIDKALHIYALAKENGIHQESITIGMAEIAFSIGLKEKACKMLLPLREFPSIIKGIEYSFATKQYQTVETLIAKARTLGLDAEQKKTLLYWDAMLSMCRGNIEKCLSLCEECAEPVSAEMDNLKGAALYLQGKLGDSARSLTKAIEKRNVWALYNLSLVYFAGGASSQAAGILKRILDTPEIIEDPSTVKATLAYVNFFSDPEKNYGLSSQMLKEAQIHNPQNPLPYYLLGEIGKTQADQQEVAFQSYQRALSLDFQITPALISLGVLSVQSNNLSDSIRYFQEASFRNMPGPWKANVHSYIALVYAHSEEFVKAQEQISLAYKIEENHIFSLQISAWISNKKGAVSEAISTLEILLGKMPKNEYALRAKEAIEENQGLFLWSDQFQREDSEKIRRQWQEIEQDGIDIALREGKAVFSGSNIKGNVPAFLLRSTESHSFISIKADISNSESNMAYTGILYGNIEGDCLYFGKNSQNQLVYAKTKQGTPLKWQSILDKDQPVLMPEKAWNNLQIMRSRKEKNALSLVLDGKILVNIPWDKEKPGKKDIGFFGLHEANISWQLSIDNIQLVEKQ
ncbi:MAG: hypothetical protein HUU50_17275 [Candidatus Brocadiae bacterium]|nr:hypothetical protein [Candidatus Brocadiia bacterium]